MSDLFGLIWCALIGLFRSRAALEAEILVLRHQLNVLRRKSPKRLAFGNVDRLVFAGLYRVAPGVLEALKILKPQTVIRWHRAGFRAYWRWKSRPLGGRPKTPADIRHLIREMSVANPLWGAPRIHGERNPGHECSRNGHTGSAHRATIAWQNGCAERVIGSIRRDCLDHVVVFGEQHLRHLLKSYQQYYNEARTHLSLEKDAPISRAVQTVGQTLAVPILGGLHLTYAGTGAESEVIRTKRTPNEQFGVK